MTDCKKHASLLASAPHPPHLPARLSYGAAGASEQLPPLQVLARPGGDAGAPKPSAFPREQSEGGAAEGGPPANGLKQGFLLGKGSSNAEEGAGPIGVAPAAAADLAGSPTPPVGKEAEPEAPAPASAAVTLTATAQASDGSAMVAILGATLVRRPPATVDSTVATFRHLIAVRPPCDRNVTGAQGRAPRLRRLAHRRGPRGEGRRPLLLCRLVCSLQGVHTAANRHLPRSRGRDRGRGGEALRGEVAASEPARCRPLQTPCVQPGVAPRCAMQIVFVSSDNDPRGFKNYYAPMPWLALPFAGPIRDKVSRHFKVRGVPALVLIDGDSGEVINRDGRAAISADPSGAKFPWRPPSVWEALGTELLAPGGENACDSLEVGALERAASGRVLAAARTRASRARRSEPRCEGDGPSCDRRR